MSYEKLGFVSGQKLKAEHLNHMEEGIFNAMNNAGGAGIIDVVELPTENINEGAFYRLLTGYYIHNQYYLDDFTVHCVETLPAVGLPATDAEIANGNIYYSIADNAGYGYVDEMLAAGMGVPAGWYDGATLIGALGYTYGGVITDIEDDPCDDAFRLLLRKDFYIYQDGWCKVPFAYEKSPKIDIQWDGDMDGHIALDMSLLGYENTYFVKVSDDVFTTDDMIGWEYVGTSYDGGSFGTEIDTYAFDTTAYPGAFTINDYVVVLHDSDMLATALGIPTGIYTNGVYFWLHTDVDGTSYISRLVSPTRIAKIDSKYLDVDLDVSVDWYDITNKPEIYHDVIRYNTYYSLGSTYRQNVRKTIDVYSKSEVDTKISNAGGNVDLSGYAKTTDLAAYAKTTDVETMIADAIGSAIGGSY